MGPAPKGCPGPTPQAQTVADFVGPVVLGPPVWAGVYAGFDATTNTYAAHDAPLTEDGWRIKILFLLEARIDSSVELTGQGVAGTDGAVLFAVEASTPSLLATLDPSDPAIPEQHEGWLEYPTYVYFPSPGCYRLIATHAAGSSIIGFGIGG